MVRGVWLLALFLLACGENVTTGGEGWPRASPDSIRESGRRERYEKAEAAAKLLGGRLMERLGEAIAEGGANHAIEVCRDDAPGLAREVGEEAGVRIGRTSHRLRNPLNQPPPWAEDLVEDGIDTASTVFSGPDGTLGVVFPIRLAEMCVRCHGPEEEIDPDLLARIREAYPEDRAVGFSPGDLRGWFWVEVLRE